MQVLPYCCPADYTTSTVLIRPLSHEQYLNTHEQYSVIKAPFQLLIFFLVVNTVSTLYIVVIHVRYLPCIPPAHVFI